MKVKPIPAEALEPIPLSVPEGSPLKHWADGTYRVGDTRIHFWLVARSLLEGDSCEEVVASLPALKLEQVQWIDRFIRENRSEVDEHLRILTEHEAIIERHTRDEALQAKFEGLIAERNARLSR